MCHDVSEAGFVSREDPGRDVGAPIGGKWSAFRGPARDDISDNVQIRCGGLPRLETLMDSPVWGVLRTWH